MGTTLVKRAEAVSPGSSSYASEFPRTPLLETVWKIRMGFTMGSDETLKRGQKPSYCRFCATKTRYLDPSSYFPNSFRRGILGNSGEQKEGWRTYASPYPLAHVSR